MTLSAPNSLHNATPQREAALNPFSRAVRRSPFPADFGNLAGSILTVVVSYFHSPESSPGRRAPATSRTNSRLLGRCRRAGNQPPFSGRLADRLDHRAARLRRLAAATCGGDVCRPRPSSQQSLARDRRAQKSSARLLLECRRCQMGWRRFCAIDIAEKTGTVGARARRSRWPQLGLRGESFAQKVSGAGFSPAPQRSFS